jgi:hypothetical protein
MAGMVRGRFRYLAPLVLFVVLRSLFLGTLENPEPRYTLECYPVIIVLAAGVFAKRGLPGEKHSLSQDALVSDSR